MYRLKTYYIYMEVQSMPSQLQKVLYRNKKEFCNNKPHIYIYAITDIKLAYDTST